MCYINSKHKRNIYDRLIIAITIIIVLMARLVNYLKKPRSLILTSTFIRNEYITYLLMFYFLTLYDGLFNYRFEANQRRGGTSSYSKQELHSFELLVRDSQQADAGTYNCVARNDYGEQKAEINLDVLGEYIL